MSTLLGLLLLLPFFFIDQLEARLIKTYFLNKNFNQLNPIDNTNPNIECLYTKGPFYFPKELTICFRTRPISYVNTFHVSLMVVSFGIMRDDWVKLEEGFFFGVWKTGPWLGIKQAGSDSIGWVGGGDGNSFNFLLWRHTCFSINRVTGRFKLVENGKKVWDKVVPDVVNWMGKMNFTANIFTLGTKKRFNLNYC